MVTWLSVTLPAVVALIGISLTYLANKRLAQDREQSQARVKLDAAIRAADLFHPTGDPMAGAARSAAGLLALTQLDQSDLAVALLADLWNPPADPSPHDTATGAATRSAPPALGSAQAEARAQDSIGVSAETAIQVIDSVLRSRDLSAQVIAAELLCRNAKMLDICKAIHWPSEINGKWNAELPVAAKLLIVDALVHMALASNETNALRELAVRLYAIWALDPQERVKGSIGTLMNTIYPALKKLGGTEFLPDFGQLLISLDQIRKAADSAHPHPDGYFEDLVTDRCRKLERWANRLTKLSTVPGMLAPASVPLRRVHRAAVGIAVPDASGPGGSPSRQDSPQHRPDS
jgi:hypothetical protein